MIGEAAPAGGRLLGAGQKTNDYAKVAAFQHVNLEERLALVREVGEEIVTEEDLRTLFAEDPHPIAYDGFEPSGTAHIAQGVMRAINVNKMTRAGCKFKMFVADWHAWANNKMGGDLEKIQTTGKYLIEIWRATGMDLSKVEFVWASELIKDEEYWKTVMNIARDSSLDRVLRTTQIMGRSEKDKLSAAQILYPCMQAADIFHLKADITQLGMDQRKVNMLAREVGPKLGFWKPVVVSHHMLMGLNVPPAHFDRKGALEFVRAVFYGTDLERRISHREGLTAETTAARNEILGKLSKDISWDDADLALSHLQSTCYAKIQELALLPTSNATFKEIEDWKSLAAVSGEASNRIDQSATAERNLFIERANMMKMSKSNPDSAIFMTDTPDQVAAKIKKAFCPEKQATENPILEYYRHIIFERFPSVKIERPAKFGGDLEFKSYGELESAFVSGALHPADAKAGAAKHINLLLDPVREHFEKNAAARELRAQVESFKVTR